MSATPATKQHSVLPARFWPLLLLCLLPSFVVSGQETGFADIEPDHDIEHQKEVHISNPVRATMLSATLPGMGQIYNRKYWKVPIIYAGFGTLAYFLNMNSTEYQRWRQAYVARVDGNPNTVDDYPFHSTHVLNRAMNYYRRNLEVTYILGAALYLLNILDASVDAHLMDFDVGEDLALHLHPQIIHGYGINNRNAAMAGMRITLKF
jgi:hypothetical protein